MPLYEYRCRSCGERTEVLQHLGDAPLAECPKCGGPVEKVLSAPALRFKGSGWYVTDYSKKHAVPANGSGEKHGSGGDAAKKPDAPASKPDGPSKPSAA